MSYNTVGISTHVAVDDVSLSPKKKYISFPSDTPKVHSS